jgi:hypothetical protein
MTVAFGRSRIGALRYSVRQGQDAGQSGDEGLTENQRRRGCADGALTRAMKNKIDFKLPECAKDIRLANVFGTWPPRPSERLSVNLGRSIPRSNGIPG